MNSLPDVSFDFYRKKDKIASLLKKEKPLVLEFRDLMYSSLASQALVLVKKGFIFIFEVSTESNCQVWRMVVKREGLNVKGVQTLLRLFERIRLLGN